MQGEGLTLEKLIKEAADIGYAGVELWARANAPFDEIVGLAKAHGLDIPCMSGHDSLPDGLNK